MQKKVTRKNNKTVNYEALVSLGELRNGMRVAEITSIDHVKAEPFRGLCKVQLMRDGNIYLIQVPKRLRNKPRFRDDNSSLTIGRDHMVYFYFCMPEVRLNEVPQQLVRQANAIAQKVLRELIQKSKPVNQN